MAELPLTDLEALWVELAEAIDRAGPEREKLFLAKLALLMGNAIGDAEIVRDLIEAALKDL
jgi:hypothetical protein